jgi:hypothetical protein
MDDAEEKTLWKQNDLTIEMRKDFKISDELMEMIEFHQLVSYDFYTYKKYLILPFLKKGGYY